MKIPFLLLIHYILDSQASFSVPAPVNATLVSNNFQHILRWLPGRDTPPQAAYGVKQWKNGREKRFAELRHRNHTLDVSRHMKDMYAAYTFHLWATLGNRTSSVVSVTPANFCPYEMTTIGPPSVDLLGSGDCLNMTIALPKGEAIKDNDSIIYYNKIRFFVHWKKARDDKGVRMHHWDPSSHQQNATYVTFVYVLENLQPQEEYCVKVQPNINLNSNTLSSDWICAFTSTVQPKGAFMVFLIGWSVGSVLVGVCVFLIIATLAYTGFLCTLKVARPKVLTGLALGYTYISLEKVYFSVAESVYSVKMTKRKDRLQPVEGDHTQQHEGKGHSKEEDDDDDYDEDDDEDDEDSNRHCAYIEREADSRDSCTTDNVQSTSSTATCLCETVNNDGVEDVPVQAEESTHSELQLHVLGDDKQMSLPDSVGQKPEPPKSKELEKEKVQIEEEAGRGGLRNINLLSVTLKSMQIKEEWVTEDTEICEPLLRDQQEDSLSLSKPQTEQPQLSELQTPILYQKNSKVGRLTGQKELKDFSEMRSNSDQLQVKVTVETGGIQIDNDYSSEEDEDYCSGYMRR